MKAQTVSIGGNVFDVVFNKGLATIDFVPQANCRCSVSFSNAPIFDEGSILETIYNHVSIRATYWKVLNTKTDNNGFVRQILVKHLFTNTTLNCNEETTVIVAKNTTGMGGFLLLGLNKFLQDVFDPDYIVTFELDNLWVSLGADSWPFIDGVFVIGD